MVNFSSELCTNNQEAMNVEHGRKEETPTQHVQHKDNQISRYKEYFEQDKIFGLYLCPCNKFRTKYRSSYTRHIRDVHIAQDKPKLLKENSLVCFSCSYKTESQFRLSLHLAVVHRTDGGPFECPILRCDFNTEKEKQLRLHLTDVHELQEDCDPTKFIFKCPVCLHIACSEVLLKAHEILVHATSSETPYVCPWPKCLAELKTKTKFKEHLKGIHGLNIKDYHKACITGDVNDEPLISCDLCNHKSQTDIQMKIHKLFQHHAKGQTDFACPIFECLYTSVSKHNVKRHLERLHKFGVEYFQDYGDPRGWQMDEDVSEYALQGLKDVNKYRWRKSRKGRYDCKYCKYSSQHGNVDVRRHTERVHAVKQCDVCQKRIRGKFQMFWHNYVIHRDTSQVSKWLIICALCGYEGLTKDGYQHGITHKLPKVSFNALRQNLSAGTITFRYGENLKADSDNQAGSIRKRKRKSCNNKGPTEEGEGDDYIAPSAVKVLDWTMSGDESAEAKPLRQSDNEETITIQFKEDSGNEEDRDIRHDNKNNDILVIKSDMTCKQCPYEAQDVKSLNIHTSLEHGRWRIKKSGAYQCPIENCPFTSTYKYNYVRHLKRVHEIEAKQYYRPDDNSTSDESVSDRREIDGNDQGRIDMEDVADFDYVPKESEDSGTISDSSNFRATGEEEESETEADTKRKKNVIPIIYQCSLCPHQTSKRHRLKLHVYSCIRATEKKSERSRKPITSGFNFKCEYCFMTVKKLEDLVKHKESHKSLIDSGLIECSYCNYKFFTPDEYKVHQNFHCHKNADQSDNFNASSELCSNNQETINVEHDRDEETPTQNFQHNDNKISHYKDYFGQRRINGLYSCPCNKFQTKYRSSYTRHIKVMHIAQGIDKVLKNNSLNCSKCFYKTDSQLELSLHLAVVHRKNGRTFTCPKLRCDFNTEQEQQLRLHLTDVHEPSASDVNDEPLISCDICNHKSLTDIQMKIHKLFQHHANDQTTFACPITKCLYNSVSKRHVKRHLECIHNFGAKHFQDYGDPRGWQMDKDVSEHALQGLKEVNHTPIINIIKNRYKWKQLKKKRYDCKYCKYSTQHGISVRRHTERNHAVNQCDVCQKTIRGKFQMFWHNYVIHRDISEVSQWLIVCALCGYAGLTKDGYQHGITHKLPKVTFNAFRQSLQAGTITFRYGENLEGDSDNQAESITKRKRKSCNDEDPTEEDEGDDYIAPGVVKGLDWTMSNDETAEAKPLRQSDNEETITIQFKENTGNEEDRIIRHDNENDDFPVIKSEYITCKHCPYEARDVKSLNIHNNLTHFRWRGAREYKCPTENCPFTSTYKYNYIRHLKRTHKIEIKQYYPPDESSTSDHSVSDMREIDGKDQEPELNLEQTWEEDLDNEVDSFMKKTDFSGKRVAAHVEKAKKLKQLTRYNLKCTVCPYESQTKKDAYRHGWQHYRVNHIPIVTFNKFIKDHPRGCLKFSYSTKFERRCGKCRFVGLTEIDLYKHKLHKHKGDLKATDRRQAKEMIRKQMVLTRKQARELNNQKRKLWKRKQSRKLRNIKESANLTNTLQQQEEVEIHSLNAEKSSKHVEKLIIQIDNEIEVKCSSFMDVDVPEDNSVVHEKQSESYSLEELQQIIGISCKSPSRTEGDSKIATIDSDWIAALEEEVLNDEDIGNGEENEIIRIEFTGDSDEEDHGKETELNVTGDVPLETGMLPVKCKNEGCVYTCRDLKDINKHSKSCSRDKGLCEWCQAVFNDKESLTNHLKNYHLIGVTTEKNINKADKNDISYQCSMCGAALSCRKSLKHHTYVHARTDNNFNLEVKFLKYKGDEIVDTKLIKADPNYKPRESSNVPLYKTLNEKCTRPPVLDYDPNLPVYSCTECNFKTNVESELTKHKNLHWTTEKEKAFKERKWFTCGVCYYHCLDVAAFKKHGEKHRDRPIARIGVKKASKDSWLF